MKPLTDSPLIEPLTEREEDVLALLVEGKTNREIAEELVLSINTVKWYNREIYGKLGVENREEAAERARELGMVEVEEQEGRPTYNLPHLPLPHFNRRPHHLRHHPPLQRPRPHNLSPRHSLLNNIFNHAKNLPDKYKIE